LALGALAGRFPAAAAAAAAGALKPKGDMPPGPVN